MQLTIEEQQTRDKLTTFIRPVILNHSELYLGPLHQQAVIGNIQK